MKTTMTLLLIMLSFNIFAQTTTLTTSFGIDDYHSFGIKQNIDEHFGVNANFMRNDGLPNGNIALTYDIVILPRLDLTPSFGIDYKGAPTYGVANTYELYDDYHAVLEYNNYSYISVGINIVISEMEQLCDCSYKTY